MAQLCSDPIVPSAVVRMGNWSSTVHKQSSCSSCTVAEYSLVKKTKNITIFYVYRLR